MTTASEQTVATGPTILDRAMATASAVVAWFRSLSGWSRWLAVAIAAGSSLYYAGYFPTVTFGKKPERTELERQVQSVNDAVLSLRSEVLRMRADLQPRDPVAPSPAQKGDVDALRRQIVELEAVVRSRFKTSARKSR